MKRFDIEPTQGGGLDTQETPFGDWVRWEDVTDLETNMDKAIRLLIEARHVCAHPDMNTGLLAEIDALLNKVGETNLPELH